MGWESHHSRSTHPRHLGQHSANLSPATPMCLLSSPDSDLFLSAQGAGFNRPYTLNNYLPFCPLPGGLCAEGVRIPENDDGLVSEVRPNENARGAALHCDYCHARGKC